MTKEVYTLSQSNKKQILLIKMSSMGDLVHCFPALTDLMKAYPNQYELTWIAEEAFVDIAKMHPATTDVIPVALRRWRKSFLSKKTREEYRDLKKRIQSKEWDYVIDAQGLMKSIFIARLAKKPIHGYDKNSGREWFASLFYHYKYNIPWSNSAILRNRRLVSQSVGYAFEGAPDFGIPHWHSDSQFLPSTPFIVLLHGTSMIEKEWDEANWIELGIWLNEHNLPSILFWGNDREHQRAERIANAIPNAVVIPKISLKESSEIIAQASLVVSLDTGLAHIANTQNRSMVGLYFRDSPDYSGVVPTAKNSQVTNLGGVGENPSVDAVKSVIKGYQLW